MYTISLAKFKKQLLRETKKEIMLKEAKIFLKVLICFIVIIKKENSVANYIEEGGFM